MNDIITVTKEKKFVSSFSASRNKEWPISLPQERVHLATWIDRQPELQKCTPESIQHSLLSAASAGITLDPNLGHAYLIPYYNKKTGVHEAHLHISYRGLIHASTRDNQFKYVRAAAVYQNDVFHVDQGTTVEVTHKIAIGGRGNIIGAWALAETMSGDRYFEYLTIDQIRKIRDRSKNKDGLAWKVFFEEMARKCAVRRLLKYTPASPKEVLEVMNRYEGLEPSDVSDQVVRVISDEQCMELHAMLSDAGMNDDDVQRWMKRLCQIFGLKSVADMPADMFDKARSILADALAKRNEQ